MRKGKGLVNDLDRVRNELAQEAAKHQETKSKLAKAELVNASLMAETKKLKADNIGYEERLQQNMVKISAIKVRKANLKREIRSLRDSLTNSRSDFEEELGRSSTERSVLVEQITDQNGRYERLLREITAKDVEIEELQRKSDIEENEIQRLRKECREIRISLETEMELAVSKSNAKAEGLKKEIDLLRERLEEEKRNWENEKKRLFGFVTSEFGQFFKVAKEPGEEMFRSLVVKARRVLARLIASDDAIRKVVGADQLQSSGDSHCLN
jgi:predicted  nucleic acid-binding Zn-ribbon protein